MLIAVLLLLAGVAVLPFAADRFVVAATHISRSLGVSPVLVGALLVGFGTSLPEMVVSGLAASRGEADFAVANIVGSNVANLALVLGGAAIIAPVLAHKEIIRREGPLVLAVTILYVGLLIDDRVQRWEAGVLLAALVGALYLLVRWSRMDMQQADQLAAPFVAIRPELTAALLTMMATVLAATALIEGAERLAEELEIKSAVIGVSLVAVGTSLPELATALAAIRRRAGDLVLGNVLGSNLFNVLAVGGVAGLLGPGAIDPDFGILLVIMLVLTALTGFLVISGNQLVRWEGFVLLASFIGFITVAAPALA
ncbi:MAG: calcium/sodium antiporter [Acidimicrobiia bacterium]